MNRTSEHSGHGIYVGEVRARSAASGLPETITYTLYLINIINPDDQMTLSDHTPKVRMFSNVIINAAPVGTQIMAVKTASGITVYIPETCVYEERCT